jgi:multidrug efflux pump
MANFFIQRPVFAWVLAIILMIAGGLAILKLPVAQYPTIAPPAVAISATYPGADAQTVQDTVTQVIEQNMNGIDNLMYMSSTSDSAGSVTITLTFESGTDPDIAQVQVQNKLQLAMPLLPQEVQQQGLALRNPAAASCWSPALFQTIKASRRMTSLTMSHRTSKMPSAERLASATFSCLAPSMRCASGSTAMR